MAPCKKGLREVNNAAVFVPPVDKIINDIVLVFFANKIIKNNYFLVVHRKLFEFDETYPFGDEFRPDAPTPSSSPPPPLPPPPYHVDGDAFPPPPPPLMEETSKRKEWAKPGPVEPEYQHESTLLQTVNQLITKYGNDPNYKVGKSKLGLKGKTIAEL